jgi:hypothetical protein
MQFVGLVHVRGNVFVCDLSDNFTRRFVCHDDVQRLSHRVIRKRQSQAVSLEIEFRGFLGLSSLGRGHGWRLGRLQFVRFHATHSIILMHDGVGLQREGGGHTSLSRFFWVIS